MKKLLYILIGLGIAGGIIGYRMWNKPHRDMASATTDIAVEAATIFKEFSADETSANAKYLDKVIAVTGTVKETSKDSDGLVKVSLNTGEDFTVRCELDTKVNHTRTDFPVGEKVTFKGTCSGINFDVIFDRCIETK